MLAAASFLTAMSAWAMPVDDITLKNVTPKAGELDIELRSLDQVTLTFTSSDIIIGEDAKATLACPDGTTLTSSLVQNRYMKNTVLLDFPDVMPYNGEYTLTIKRWSLGDAEWLGNPETGHSNPKIEVKWTVINGLEAGIAYDIEPISVTPANNASIDYNTGGAQLRQIKIVFPSGTYVNPSVPVIISNTEARYSQELLFEGKRGSENVTYTATVSPAPLISGNYYLTIPGGAFGDEEFISGNGGHASAPINYVYSVTGAMTEDGEEVETTVYDYNPESFEIKKPDTKYEAVLTWGSAPEIDETALINCRLLDDQNFAVAINGLDLKKDESGTETVISFEATLDLERKYRFVVAQDIFGNSLWTSTDRKKGSANPQMSISFLPSEVTVGVDSITADGKDVPNSVYTATGIRLYGNATDDEIRNLPAGLYIIAGKKVMVK